MDEQTDTRLSEPAASGPVIRERLSRRRMTWWRRALFAVGAPVVVGVLALVWATYRFRVHGEEKIHRLAADGKPMVLAIWHDGLFVLPWFLLRLAKRGVRVTYLISPSVDGEFGVKMVDVVGGYVVRGSATRSGAAALRGLFRAIRRDNASPLITLDGPKGPRHHCKPGAVMIGHLAGVPIVPIACASRWSWRLPTWDRLLVPVPLARVAINVGDPFTVPSGSGEVDLEAHRAALEERFAATVTEAEARAGRRGRNS